MSASWHDDDEDFKIGGRAGIKSKPRFTFTEVKMLLDAVKRNRYIILKKFNHGVSAESKKLAWAEITNQINALGENHREVRQIMKKWADLKCDGKRRIIAMRGPNGKNVRKKRLGPVEQMVHKILMMSPNGDGESEAEFVQEEDLTKLYGAGGLPAESEPLPFISVTDSSYSVDLSPPSSPGRERGGEFQSSDYEMPDDGERAVDFDDDDYDSLFSSSCPDQPPPPPLLQRPPPGAELCAEGAAPRIKLLHTYSRATSQQPPSSSSRAPSGPPSSSPPPSPKASNGIPSTASAHGRQTSPPSHSSSSSSKTWSDPLPSAKAASGGRQQLGQVVQQSLQLQAASRTLLAGVSRSLETLAQSVQQLVETQQEYSHESLLLQREALTVLRDFSSSALAVLRDKGGGGGAVGGGGVAAHRQHATPRF